MWKAKIEGKLKWKEEVAVWKAKNEGTPEMRELLEALEKYKFLKSRNGCLHRGLS